MTIDEAIKRSEEVMVENMEKTKGRNASDPIAIYCFECAEEYRQLAEWLKDYKRLLEQEPCIQEKQANADKIDVVYIDGFKAGYSQAKFDLEQEPCDDVISRGCNNCAYYVNGANDEACDGCFADEYEHPNFKPKAQPCDNCISRQAVEEMIKAEMPERGMWEIEGDKEKETVCEVCVDLMQKLSKLQPIKPQSKIGHWIKKDGYSDCSECSSHIVTEWDYCPKCGAKMQEVEE